MFKIRYVFEEEMDYATLEEAERESKDWAENTARQELMVVIEVTVDEIRH